MVTFYIPKHFRLEDENLEEDSLFVSIGDLMGILFKTHKELTLGIVE